MNKFIFLDIDGVLNSEEYFVARAGGKTETTGMIDPILVSRLNRVVQATGAKVVISSSWGFNKDTINALKGVGAKFDPIDGTDKLHYKFEWACRGNEIDHWLHYRSGLSVEDYYDENFNYVIFDDDTDMLLKQKDNFINTSFMTGITNDDVLKAIEILNRE